MKLFVRGAPQAFPIRGTSGHRSGGRLLVVTLLTVLAVTVGSLPAGAQPTKAAGAAVDPAEAAGPPDPFVAAELAANAVANGPLYTTTYNGPIVIPAVGTGGNGSSGVSNPYPAQLTVAGQSRPIGRLEVRLNHFTHSFPSDLSILLVGPGGQRVMLMQSAGVPAIEGGFVTFSDAGGPITDTQLSGTTVVPTGGTYAIPSPAPPLPYEASLSVFAGTDPNGVWSLYVWDGADQDVGRLYGFSLLITPLIANTSPVAITDLSTIESAISVTGLSGTVTKVTVSMYITHTFAGDIDATLVAPNGTTVLLTSDNGSSLQNYGSGCGPGAATTFDDWASIAITAANPPFVGTFRPEGALGTLFGHTPDGTWKLRVTDDANNDVGILRCWSLAITTTEPVQPPTALSVANVVGNTVTFTWTPSPAGAIPTSFVLEGGISPGQVLATFPTAGPNVSLTIPSGAFHVRVRSVAGTDVSSASNELPIYVNVPVSPAAPRHPLWTIGGSTLEMSWQNAFAGGAPTQIVLDVTGAATASIPLGLVDRVRFSGVPPGAYTLALRAVNQAGSSAATPLVAPVQFPASTCAVPNAPANLRGHLTGRTLYLDWDAPLAGGAVAQYALAVEGPLTATVPTALTSLSGAVSPGIYVFRVAALNGCGSSPMSSFAYVAVP
jgi:subtilisin-like proprotein convertase family protein